MTKELIPILETKEESVIKNKIYNFRGKEVMLDSDIAEMFNVEVKNLNKAMKRNPNRFHSDFCFQLNSKELASQRFQNVTFRESTKNRKYVPFVYTEQGIIRFLEDFCFKLIASEYSNLRFQNVTANSLSSFRRYHSYVYTKQHYWYRYFLIKIGENTLWLKN